MKLNKLLIFPLILTLFGTSCSNKNKIIIEQKENIDSFVYLNNDELTSLIKNKQDFVLVVGENGCLTCETIKPVITDYIKKYEYVIYWIENNIYQTVVDKFVTSEDQALKANIMSASILLFNDGVTKEVIEYNENLYFSENKFELTLEDKITGSNLYSLNTLETFEYSKKTTMYKMNLESTTDLDNKIASKEDVLVLFSWAPCPDCSRIKQDVLNEYMANKDKKLYIFEVAHYRQDLTNKPELYEQFANKYQFDSYRGGKVPTIAKYNDSKLVNMHVYFNDEFEKQEDGSYLIKNSFIPRLINSSYQNGSKMIEELKQIHKEETIAYLDSNL